MQRLPNFPNLHVLRLGFSVCSGLLPQARNFVFSSAPITEGSLWMSTTFSLVYSPPALPDDVAMPFPLKAIRGVDSWNSPCHISSSAFARASGNRIIIVGSSLLPVFMPCMFHRAHRITSAYPGASPRTNARIYRGVSVILLMFALCLYYNTVAANLTPFSLRIASLPARFTIMAHWNSLVVRRDLSKSTQYVQLCLKDGGTQV